MRLKFGNSLLSVASGLGMLIASVGGTSAVNADYSVTILHTNDVHSRLAPVNKYDSSCSSKDAMENKCFGGMARVLTAVRDRRGALASAGENVLTLDAGDQFQGSLFYTTYKGRLAVQLMNMVGYDAMAVGNHEFDDGPNALTQFALESNFPILFANSDLTADSGLNGLVHGAVVKNVGGQLIGIIGVLAEDTVETSSPGETVAFESAVTATQTYVDHLEAQGINKIILLSHIGLPGDISLASEVTGIDVIVGGHSHTLLSNTQDRARGPYPTMANLADGKQVPIVQAYAYSRFLGELKVTFDDAGNLKSAVGDVMPLDASVKEDAEAAALIAEYAGPLEEMKNQIVGEAAALIDGNRASCRAIECHMGTLVTDAILDRTKSQGVTLVIQNGGGLRASIDAGPITMGEVLTVLPFQNSIATFELTGAGVIAALENGVSKVDEGAGRFPQVAGMRYTFDAAAEAGSRIVSVEVENPDGSFSAIDEAASYMVASNNYMRSGGDGYKVFKEEGMNAYDYGPGLEEAVADYLSANSPYVPSVQGRVMIK